MTVDTSLKVLVVVLSSALGLFLILAVVLVVKMIQVTNYVKQFVKKADEIADHAEAVTAFFERSAPPVVVGRLVSNIMDALKSKHKSGKDK